MKPPLSVALISLNEERNLRLVRMDKQPRWQGHNPHDSMIVQGTEAHLTGDLIHYSDRDVRQHFEKTIYYAALTAESYYARGRWAGIVSLTFRPAFAFIRSYFLPGWCVDGVRGFMAAVSAGVYVFLKYGCLWEKQHASHQNSR